ncbi:uncharacterized protein JCM15063_004638 [Sporobolomyces koalae]|uniref:uncharacterized protein n=1 Tax=Sporobolomyces koalae TaxID=500713 RepID=UPI00317E707C
MPSAATDDSHTLAPTEQPATTVMKRPRAGTNGTLDSAYLPDYFSPHHPPPLDFQFNARYPLAYLLFLLACNVLIPCLLYYLPHIYTTISDKELIGIGSASLGLSSCFDAPFRMYKRKPSLALSILVLAGH